MRISDWSSDVCSSDLRLYPSRLARLAESHDTVEPVAIGHRDRGKAAVARRLGDRFRLDRPFEHRVAGKDAEGDKGAGGHGGTVGIWEESGKRKCANSAHSDRQGVR